MSETALEAKSNEAPWWVWPAVAAFGFACLAAVGLGVAVVYLMGTPGGGGENRTRGIPSAKTLQDAFPGDDQDRSQWVALLAQYAQAVARDAEQKIPTLRTTDQLKSRWRECQRVRTDHRGRGSVWGDEYATFGGLLESRIDNAVGQTDRLTIEDANAARDAFASAAQELAGSDWGVDAPL